MLAPQPTAAPLPTEEPQEEPPEEPPPEEPPEELPEEPPAVELPPPEEAPETVIVPDTKIFTIRPEVLAGLLKTSPQAAADSGGAMEEDSAQLVLTPPERKDFMLPASCAALAAFVLGFSLEIVRFRRLRKR